MARAATVLLLPLLTRYIQPAEWGSLTLLLVIGDLAALAILCQLQVALFRAWAAAPDERERQHLAGAVFLAPLAVSSILFLPGYVFAGDIARLLGIEGYGGALRLLLVTQQINVLQMVLLAEVRLRDESRRYALVELVQNIGQALLSIAFVAALGLGVRGMLLAQFVAVVATFLFLLPRFLRRAVPNLRRARLSPLFGFALPLLPSALAMAGVHNVDRFILQAFLGEQDLGIYSLGYKLGFAINVMLVAPFLLVWEPKSFEIAGQPDAPRRIGRIATWFMAVAGFLLAGAAGASREIVRVMAAPEYAAAASVVAIVAGSYVLFGADAIARVGLLAAGRSRTVLGVVLLSLAVKTGASLALVPVLGISGAAWATLAGFATLLALDVVLSRPFLPIAWEKGRLAVVLLAGTGTAVAMHAVRGPDLLQTIVLKGAVLLAYPLILLAAGFLRGVDPRRARQAAEDTGLSAPVGADAAARDGSSSSL